VGVRTGTLGLGVMATVRPGINGRSVMGRNTQVASVDVDCKRLMPLGGSLCGKTPVIHNLTTYKHALTFQYPLCKKFRTI
jgi:hypothetical protein